MSEDKALATMEQSRQMDFFNKDGFELIQRIAGMFAKSDLVPANFKGNLANCVIGLEMAQRLGASPLAVLQNIYIVHGKPGWSAQFIIAAVNSTGKFSPLRFAVDGEDDAKTCIAWAIEKETGERLEGPPVSIDMAKKEGWYNKNGSKWQTMPELMLRYRAATFFGRLYAPEILMGMQTMEELTDTVDLEADEFTSVADKTASKADELKEKIRSKKKAAPIEQGPKEYTVCPDTGPMAGEEVSAKACEGEPCRENCPAWTPEPGSGG